MSRIHYFTVRLPVKTYIRKYITSNYGDPLLLNLDTDIGFLMLSTLTSRLESKMSRGYLDLWKNRFTDEITFRIPYHFFSITRKSVPPTTYILVNRFLESIFERDLSRYVSLHRAAGHETKKAIELFCENNRIDLEVDISYEAIKKQEYRSRKKIFEKSSRILSPQKTLFG